MGEGCGVFFPNKEEYLDHLSFEDKNHCQFCGFVIASSAEASISTDLFCPACRINNDRWPEDWRKVC